MAAPQEPGVLVEIVALESMQVPLPQELLEERVVQAILFMRVDWLGITRLRYEVRHRQQPVCRP